jgi:hypothetical protein
MGFFAANRWLMVTVCLVLIGGAAIVLAGCVASMISGADLLAAWLVAKEG